MNLFLLNPFGVSNHRKISKEACPIGGYKLRGRLKVVKKIIFERRRIYE
jgi:hypothetical protein